MSSLAPALLLLLVALVGCNRDTATLQALEERQARLADEAAALTSQVSKLRGDYLRLIEEKERRFQNFAADVQTLNQTSDEIRNVMTDFAAYKKAYREKIWADAPGMKLPFLATKDHRYEEVTVRRLDSSGISIMHRNGSAMIALSELPKASRDLFAYDPTLEAVLQRSKGTGTDWLLSAIAAAEAALKEVEPAPQSNAQTVSRTSVSSSGTAPAGYYSSPYYTPLPEPAPFWQSQSSFTGSYWAPLQQRKKKVGTVNTYSTSSF